MDFSGTTWIGCKFGHFTFNSFFWRRKCPIFEDDSSWINCRILWLEWQEGCSQLFRHCGSRRLNRMQLSKGRLYSVVQCIISYHVQFIISYVPCIMSYVQYCTVYHVICTVLYSVSYAQVSSVQFSDAHIQRLNDLQCIDGSMQTLFHFKSVCCITTRVNVRATVWRRRRMFRKLCFVGRRRATRPGAKDVVSPLWWLVG